MRRGIVLWLIVALNSAATLGAFLVIRSIQEHQNDALSALVCHAQEVVQKQPGIPADQRHRALHFYEQQIRLEHLKPCR